MGVEWDPLFDELPLDPLFDEFAADPVSGAAVLEAVTELLGVGEARGAADEDDPARVGDVRPRRRTAASEPTAMTSTPIMAMRTQNRAPLRLLARAVGRVPAVC
ncbi:MAG TPA: hypothetical protein VGC05_04700 [Mycobacterium sp.]